MLRAPAVVERAAALGCVGVELRLDNLAGLDEATTSEASLQDAQDAKDVARTLGVDVIALCELRAFNDWNGERAEQAAHMIALAVACGAHGIQLLPRNDGYGHGNGERQASLRLALRELGPMLEEAGLCGFIEPLGFERSSLRSKREVVDAIESLGKSDRFRLVHDTFHHHLTGGGECFPAHTGLVHVSSVVDPTLSLSEMRDSDRTLPEERDRLGSLQQIAELRDGHFRGPVSITSFTGTTFSEERAMQALTTSAQWLGAALEDHERQKNPSNAPSRLVTSVT